MDQAEAADSVLLGHYEGLVRKTAGRYVGRVLFDYDDICQIFRVKVWKALLAWDPRDPRILKKIATGMSEDELRDRFVFMCLRNQGKDLVKRRKPETDPLFIEDWAGGAVSSGQWENQREDGNRRDRFESRYLCVGEEEVFGEIEGEDIILPPDLTADERRVLVCMYLDYTQAETALRLGLTAKKVGAAVKGIRRKLGHLNPAGTALLAAA